VQKTIPSTISLNAIGLNAIGLNAIGFDPIQQLALEQAFSTSVTSSAHSGPANSGPANSGSAKSLSLYRLTPRNFDEILATLRADRAAHLKLDQVIVTTVPSLTFLGLQPHSFPEATIFITYQEFVESLVEVITGAQRSMTEAMTALKDRGDGQGKSVERFFGREGLSQAQITLLIFIAIGHTNVEIARRMELTEKGVESAIKRLAIKLDCTREGSRPHNLRILLGRKYAQLLGVL
jgi:DNA-binding CsgD family transcriptional regulator